jgi:serine/threonine protein kinase
MTLQVAGAMAHLHAQSPPIVHRDLKSHNVLLDDEGRCRYATA